MYSLAWLHPGYIVCMKIKYDLKPQTCIPFNFIATLEPLERARHFLSIMKIVINHWQFQHPGKYLREPGVLSTIGLLAP